MNGRPLAVRGQRAFQLLIRSRRQARNGPVTVHFVPADNGVDEWRVAYSISRKVGGAVVRNRCRRRLRAIAAAASPELNAGSYLIGVSPAVTGLSFEELKERVVDTMRKASEQSRS